MWFSAVASRAVDHTGWFISGTESANGLLTLMSNLFTDLNLSDMETCYKAFRREVIQSIEIRENRFGFEPEVTAKDREKEPADLRGWHFVLRSEPTTKARRLAGRTALEPSTASSNTT